MVKNLPLEKIFVLLFHELIFMKDHRFINLNMMPKERANREAYRLDNALVFSSHFNLWTWMIIWILPYKSIFVLWNDDTLVKYKCWRLLKCCKFFLSSYSCYFIFMYEFLSLSLIIAFSWQHFLFAL